MNSVSRKKSVGDLILGPAIKSVLFWVVVGQYDIALERLEKGFNRPSKWLKNTQDSLNSSGFKK
jgi:hypothetical protein